MQKGRNKIGTILWNFAGILGKKKLYTQIHELQNDDGRIPQSKKFHSQIC